MDVLGQLQWYMNTINCLHSMLYTLSSKFSFSPPHPPWSPSFQVWRISSHPWWKITGWIAYNMVVCESGPSVFTRHIHTKETVGRESWKMEIYIITHTVKMRIKLMTTRQLSHTVSPTTNRKRKQRKYEWINDIDLHSHISTIRETKVEQESDLIGISNEGMFGVSSGLGVQSSGSIK